MNTFRPITLSGNLFHVRLLNELRGEQEFEIAHGLSKDRVYLSRAGDAATTRSLHSPMWYELHGYTWETAVTVIKSCLEQSERQVMLHAILAGVYLTMTPDEQVRAKELDLIHPSCTAQSIREAATLCLGEGLALFNERFKLNAVALELTACFPPTHTTSGSLRWRANYGPSRRTLSDECFEELSETINTSFNSRVLLSEQALPNQAQVVHLIPIESLNQPSPEAKVRV